MAGISNIFGNQYNTNRNSGLFSNTSGANSPMGGINLSDYASIRSGSYQRLLKAYYSKQDVKKEDGSSASGDTAQSLALTRSSADALKKSADALNTASLWEKKRITAKGEDGKETVTGDYDWDAITKAVKSFVKDYNDMVEQAGNSDTKGVLRHAAWMTGMTKENAKLLSEAGITVGKNNKLELDENDLKKANISTLKSLFTGYHSFSSKISQKAASIGNAAKATSGTYTSSGAYSRTAVKKESSKVDTEA